MHLNLLVLNTHDVQALVTFYTKIGLTFTEHKHGKGPVHFAYEAQERDFVFEIYPLPNHQNVDATTRLGFGVENLDSLISGLKSNGILIDSEPKEQPWGYVAVALDPDGRKVELKQQRS
ncbi:MAG: VOC family protein [Bacteroidia bacterium]